MTATRIPRGPGNTGYVKTLVEGWEMIRTVISSPPTPPPEAIEAMEACFYGGALTLATIMGTCTPKDFDKALEELDEHIKRKGAEAFERLRSI